MTAGWTPEHGFIYGWDPDAAREDRVAELMRESTIRAWWRRRRARRKARR